MLLSYSDCRFADANLTSRAAMSRGEAVKDEGSGGGSPELHKRSAEAWGNPNRSCKESLTARGLQTPEVGNWPTGGAQ
jgi:hypothetical protein